MTIEIDDKDLQNTVEQNLAADDWVKPKPSSWLRNLILPTVEKEEPKGGLVEMEKKLRE